MQVGQVVLHPGEVIDAVSIGDILVPVLPLADLLGTAVVIADVGIESDHLLPFELGDQAQHPVGAGVVRTDIEDHGVGAVRPPAFFKKITARNRDHPGRRVCGKGGHLGRP